MTAAEILTLGGSQARGVVAQTAPVSVHVAQVTTNLALAWSGGDGQYQLQRKIKLEDADWQALNDPTNETNRLVPLEGESALYRVVGL